ncbi:MAG: hypothetical protein M1828_000685 [Chrysothrix sp. TS-e1954]|nr:MAG: hypothetical protein M1828_000685 [Chrysothrix sp. TS-e1954]
MHFALPPRKTSRPPPYAVSRASKFAPTRRARTRTIAWALGVFVLLGVLFTVFRGGSEVKDVVPADTPSAVLVTVFDDGETDKYTQMIRENREQYARRQGYATFFPNITDYPLDEPPSPRSWAKIPAMRHAMTRFPHSTYFFYLDQHALFMRQDVSIEDQIMSPRRLKEIMIPEQPVVPPDSVIRTYKTLSPENVDFVISQDDEGLAQTSFIVRRGEWAKFFLDSWFDPLYRSYNFQRAEGHALEHLVQWHGTVLARMALVPQKLLNAYTKGSKEQAYVEGDYIAHFHGCNIIGTGRSSAPSMTAAVVATAILAVIGGFFIGQAHSLGLFSSTKPINEPSSPIEEELDSDDEQAAFQDIKDLANGAEECKLVLVVRTDLGMTKGKIAAQCSHATLACYKTLTRSPPGTKLLRQWERSGQAKVALQVKSEDELELLQAQAVSLGLCAQVIHDAGRTQIASGSATVLGVGPAPKSRIDEVTGGLKLL